MTIAHTGQEVKMLNQGVRVWRRKEGEEGEQREETRIDNKDERKAKTSQVSALLTTLVLF